MYLTEIFQDPPGVRMDTIAHLSPSGRKRIALEALDGIIVTV